MKNKKPESFSIKLKRITATILTASLLVSCGSVNGTDEKNVSSEATEAITNNQIDNTAIDGKSESTSSQLSSNGEYIVSDVTFDSETSYNTSTNNVVFYEIFVGSFSDSNGDGIGDLRGIINRFDYLNDGDPESGLSLGVEGIWLSPIFKSPSYHKYDVTDYYTIDPDFGTMDDLIELVNLCHERNVKIILDMVINHTSSVNQWFFKFKSAHNAGNTDDPYYNYYTWNSTGSESGRAFYKLGDSKDYYEGNFWNEMPELNFDNEEVRKEVINIARYYLTDIGVDGFRFDAAKYIYFNETERNVDFWKWYMDELKAIKSDVYTVAEVWDSDSMTDEYEEAINCFNFTMAQGEGQIANTAKKGDVNKFVSYVEKYLTRVKGINENATIMPFIANHDMDRAAGYLTVSTGMAFVGANLYILGPGSPFIYYGEEIGMKGSRGSSNTDANRRLTMLWGDGDTVKNPEGYDYALGKQTNGTVVEQAPQANSLYNYYKRLIMIRKANPEIYLGNYKALSFEGTNVGGFVSTYEGNSVCVIHNTTGSEKTIDLKDATDISFTTINAVAGSYIEGEPIATLDGTKLTISSQTSVVLRQ